MDMIAAIEDLQIDVNALDEKLERVYQDIQEINGTIRNHRSLNAHLESEIVKLKRELSSCIDVKLLYSDRQARETWQQGCDVMIETLHKRMIDLEWMLKNSVLCVDNSHADENAKRFGLAPVSQLTKALTEEINKTVVGFDVGSSDSAVFSKIKKEGDKYILETVIEYVKPHHPSRKHLENKLREKNEKVKQLTEKNVELEYKVTELLVACRDSHRENEGLNNRVNDLTECLDRKQAEVSTLTWKLEHQNCKKVCCLPPDGRYVNAVHSR